jgi:hypothetical protein
MDGVGVQLTSAVFVVAPTDIEQCLLPVPPFGAGR